MSFVIITQRLFKCNSCGFQKILSEHDKPKGCPVCFDGKVTSNEKLIEKPSSEKADKDFKVSGFGR